MTSRRPARCCRRSSSTSGSRPRWLTPCLARSSPTTSAPGGALADAGYAGDLLLLHSGGGVMTPDAVAAIGRRLAARASRRARSPAATRALCGFETRSGSTWAGRHRHLARRRRRSALDQGVVRRVRLSDLLPVDRGADDRRRRRLDRLDRPAASLRQRPAVGWRRPGPGGYGRGGEQPRTRTRTSCSADWGTDSRGEIALDAIAAEQAIADHVARPLGLYAPRRRRRDHPGGEREHGRRGPSDLDPPRLRPARVRTRRLRRRGPAARRCARTELIHPDRDRAAEPGDPSALGCLLVDIRHDLSVMYLAGRPSRPRGRRVRSSRRWRLKRRAAPRTRASTRTQSSFNVSWTCAIWASGVRCRFPCGSPVDLAAAVTTFHEEHGREHNYSRDQAPVESSGSRARDRAHAQGRLRSP